MIVMYLGNWGQAFQTSQILNILKILEKYLSRFMHLEFLV